MEKRKRLYLGFIFVFSALLLSGLLFSNVAIQKDSISELSIKIVKNTANAVYGCCKTDPGDTCNAYGAIIVDCDECFIFGNCNKNPDPE